MPWTYFLHLSLSAEVTTLWRYTNLFIILIDSSTASPVHVLMLSIQAVRGLPRLRAPGIVPCIIPFSRRVSSIILSVYNTGDLLAQTLEQFF